MSFYDILEFNQEPTHKSAIACKRWCGLVDADNGTISEVPAEDHDLGFILVNGEPES
jgi:hypothetical protein